MDHFQYSCESESHWLLTRFGETEKKHLTSDHLTKLLNILTNLMINYFNEFHRKIVMFHDLAKG